MKPETPLYARFPPIAARLDWLAPLLVRLVFGYFWLETGWAKLHNLDGFAARFVQWGIPFPELSATVSAGMEFIGGLLLMLGLLTRLTMIPMIFNMIVALVVVVLPTIGTLDEFVELDEVLYILVFFWFLMMGPGRASIDHLLFGRHVRDPRVAASSA
ncbi:MAG TPA: DoxX family protein [Solimonas sp.]